MVSDKRKRSHQWELIMQFMPRFVSAISGTNLNPLFQRTDGNIDICPVISGRNWLREAYEELEEVSYTCGRPENLSKEVRSVFCHEDDEPYDPYLHI